MADKPDVVQRLAERIQPEQGPPAPEYQEQGPPMPPEIERREAKRTLQQSSRDPQSFDRTMAYRGFRDEGRAYQPPPDADPQAVQRAKLWILLEDGKMTPDLIRQLPAEDQQWIAERWKSYQDEKALAQAREAFQRWWNPGVIDRLGESIRPDTPLPEDAVPVMDVGSVDVEPSRPQALRHGGYK